MGGLVVIAIVVATVGGWSFINRILTPPSLSALQATGTGAALTGARGQAASDGQSSTPAGAGVVPQTPGPTDTAALAAAGLPPGLTAPDLAAGLRSRSIPKRGTGALLTVSGSVAAPGTGPVKRVKVQVEQGLNVNGDLFARFVLSTLNDPRSWGHGHRMRFARTDGAYDVRVVLASPDTSATLCAPLKTMGTLSCGTGNTAVLTLYRWVLATPDYGADRTGYRHYLVNHEVGHTLGHRHEMCPGKGKVAPVMMQQTKGLLGCLPNPWPFP